LEVMEEATSQTVPSILMGFLSFTHIWEGKSSCPIFSWYGEFKIWFNNEKKSYI